MSLVVHVNLPVDYTPALDILSTYYLLEPSAFDHPYIHHLTHCYTNIPHNPHRMSFKYRLLFITETIICITVDYSVVSFFSRH